MTEIYFELLINSKLTYAILSSVIKNYCVNKEIELNTTQVLLLYFLINKFEGKTPIYNFEKEMQKMTRNHSYNFKELCHKGYVTKVKGNKVNADPRHSIIFITEKGFKVYEEICHHVRNKLNKLEKFNGLNWNGERSERYIKDSQDLQLIELFRSTYSRHKID